MIETVGNKALGSKHPAELMTSTFEVARDSKERVPEVVHEDATSHDKFSNENTTRATTA